MKKKISIVILVVATVIIPYSCGMNTPKDKMKAVVDMHNTMPDYEGIYVGKLPSANGEGMIVTIILGDKNFSKKMEYVGKKGVFEDKGEYTWNTEGNTIILNGITDSPNQYLVGENTLTQLDMDGSRITGKLSEMYVLRKQEVSRK
jgi:uncharacterized lipoprotein NlpE involved in copper resistance